MNQSVRLHLLSEYVTLPRNESTQNCQWRRSAGAAIFPLPMFRSHSVYHYRRTWTHFCASNSVRTAAVGLTANRGDIAAGWCRFHRQNAFFAARIPEKRPIADRRAISASELFLCRMADPSHPYGRTSRAIGTSIIIHPTRQSVDGYAPVGIGMYGNHVRCEYGPVWAIGVRGNVQIIESLRGPIKRDGILLLIQFNHGQPVRIFQGSVPAPVAEQLYGRSRRRLIQRNQGNQRCGQDRRERPKDTFPINHHNHLLKAAEGASAIPPFPVICIPIHTHYGFCAPPLTIVSVGAGMTSAPSPAVHHCAGWFA